MSARFIIGDARDVGPTLPDRSVDLVLTSPPFLALRSYLPPDHPDKAKEMGSEPTPGEFIDALLDVVEALTPKLARHGSMCFELGDTYAGSGGSGGDYADTGLRAGQERFDGSKSREVGRASNRRDKAPVAQPRRRYRSLGPDPRYAERGEQSAGSGAGGEWPLDKSLCLIPELFRVALVYGFNPLTGRETPRWRARNVIRWCRPNPPVGALSDKFRPATSEIVVITQARNRYFDMEAVRSEPIPDNERTTWNQNGPKQKAWSRHAGVGRERFTKRITHPGGGPPLDWWRISTKGYPGSHYATWPSELLVRPILAMCPERVCRTCGEPSRRIAETNHIANRATNGPQSIERKHLEGGSAGYAVRAHRMTTTTGWSDCDCSDDRNEAWPAEHNGKWRRGLVLDPFAGSGTTLAVATGCGLDAIGIDLDERNAVLARERVGMFLEVDDPRPDVEDVDA